MKLQVQHLTTGSVFISDTLTEELHFIEDFVYKVACGEATVLHFKVNGNSVFFPEKILAESVITILEE
jgi:hypothetical protein